MAGPLPDSGEVILIPNTSISSEHLQSVTERCRDLKLQGLKDDTESFFYSPVHLEPITVRYRDVRLNRFKVDPQWLCSNYPVPPKRYKDVRLNRFKVDPQAFCSKYEYESQFTAERWLSPIQNPLGKTFAAVIDHNTESHEQEDPSRTSETEGTQTSFESLLGKEWVGTATLLGPVPFPSEEGDTSNLKPWDALIKDGKYQIPSKPFAPGDLNGAHIVYVIVGRFVLPGVRGNGHTRRLLETIIKAAEEEAMFFGASKTSVTVQIEPENVGAQEFYEAMGFKVWDDAVLMESRHGEASNAVSLVMEMDAKI